VYSWKKHTIYRHTCAYRQEYCSPPSGQHAVAGSTSMLLQTYPATKFGQSIINIRSNRLNDITSLFLLNDYFEVNKRRLKCRHVHSERKTMKYFHNQTIWWKNLRNLVISSTETYMQLKSLGVHYSYHDYQITNNVLVQYCCTAIYRFAADRLYWGNIFYLCNKFQA